MPAFKQEQEKLPVDLGGGRDVTLTLKRIDEHSRRLIRKAHAANSYLEGRIENLMKRATDANTTPIQAVRIKEEIEQLSEEHDRTDLIFSTLLARTEAWDYYASRADMEAGRPIPLTLEALKSEQCDPMDLGKMFVAIVEHYNKDDKDDSQGNESTPMSLQPTSAQEAFSATPTESIS